MAVWPSATVRAKGGRYGAGIGGSYRGGDGCGGFIGAGESYLVLYGTVWAEGGEGAAGIGGGKGGSDGGCEIRGSTANVSAFGGTGTYGIGSGVGWDGPDQIEYKVFAKGCEVKEGPQPPGATTYIQKSKDCYHGLSRARFTSIKTSDQEPPKPTSVSYWDGEKNQLGGCTKYELIGGGTQTLTSYGWYVVRGNVKMTDHGLWCSGPDVHIILTDGCLFEIEAPDDSPGIDLDESRSLHIHPEQKDGTGTMIVSGGLNGAGIGGGVHTNGEYLSCGKLTIHGGRITCTGGAYAAGIGGSSNKGGTGGSLARELTIYGGEVTAIGGWAAAGIGGAAFGACGGSIFIDGGSIRAFGGLSRSGWLPGIGCGAGEKSERKDINTPTSRRRDFVVREGDDESVSCRIVMNDTYFSVGTNSYVGILVGRTERVAYRDGRGDMRETKAEMLIPGEPPANSDDTTSERWFVAEDGISFTQTLTLPGKTANLILPDDSSLSFAAGLSSSPALKAKALSVFGQEFGTGMMKVQGGSSASGISTDGDFALHSCLVDVTGAHDGVSGGSLTIDGGYLRVGCQTALAASGAVTMNGGTVVVTNGETHVQADSLTVSGGNLFVARANLKGGAMQPKNAAGNPLYRLTVFLPDWFGPIDDETVVRIVNWEGPASYGLDGLCPIDGKVYLWLPDGTYKFNVDCFGLKIPYEALISSHEAVVYPCEEVIDLKVNGVPVTNGQGDGWTYARGDGVLRLGERSGPFVISGSSTKGEVQIFAGSSADIVLSKARVYTSGRSAMMLAPNVSVNLRMQDGESFLSASGKWIRRRGDVTGAGIEVCPTATLTITGDDSSVLWVNGGYGSAGIGGSSRVGLGCPHSGYIHILSGTVIATGGDRGAGIGGGQRGLPYPYSGDAILLGRDANVTATGGWGAAGIGGGWGGLRNIGGLTAQGKVRLNGAIVSATGGYGAAGIGGGRYYARRIKRKKRKWFRQAAQYPAVEICGGTVYAMGGGNDEIPWRTPCSDIGQGEGSDETDESVFVRITGGTVVAARDMIAPDPIGEYAGRRYSSPLVLRASVKDGGFPENEPVSLEPYFPYGTENIYPIGGMIHLYLPDFGPDHPSWYYFNANKAGYIATMCGTNTVAQRCKEPDEWSLTVEFADHVSKDFAVSNRLGKIEGSEIDGGMVYGVKTYDRVTIDFAVDDGYVRRGGNRIVIPKVEDHVIVTQEDLAVHPYKVFDEGLNVVRSDGGQWIDLGYRSVASTRVECFAWPEISVGPGTDWSHFLSGLTTALLTLKIYEGETLVRDLVPFMSSDGSGIIGLYDTVTRKPFVNMGTGNFTLDNLGVTPYRAWNAETRQMEDRLCTNATQFVATNTTVLKSGWYEVSGNVKIGEGGIDIVGSVHLILCDGADMFLDSYGLDRPGIRVEEGASLSIYGQDRDSGKLTVRAGNDAAAIGGAFRKTCGIVDIHGGEITAVQFNRCMQGKGAAGIGGGAGNYDEKGGGGGDIRIHGGTVTVTYSQDGWASGAGIGGGSYADGGTVVIDGGTVTVQGGTLGAGIGGGRSGSGGNVTINGGTVEARGGRGTNGYGGAAGIGSGGETGMNPPPSSGGVTTINGGFVKAIGDTKAFGIGAGASSSGRMEMGVITINGGTVVTTEWDDKDPSIGGDTTNSRLTIDGGSVKAWTVAGLAKNSKPANVHRVTVKCTDLEGLVSVKGLEGYGTKDIYALRDDKKEASFVYLWLPDGTHRFTLSDGMTTLRYCVVVKGRDVQIEPLPPVREIGFFVNGRDIGETPGEDDGWRYQDKVLTLEGAKTYVLSGAATNNEVQVKVARQGATVVLSNAVVFAEGREALDVAQSAALQMAGGASFLGTAKDFAAVKVAEGMALAVDLASGADRNESMIGVFNSGSANAVSGTGAVTVNGGTFFAWAGGQAVETPSEFRFGAGLVMKTGDTPEAMRFVKVCGNAPCVLVAPGVTVTVKSGIPHVTGHTVSNAVEEIESMNVPDGKVYRVMLGDDIFVGYMVEKGYFSRVANPLVYPEIEGDKTVDAGSIEIWPTIPYRAWNETTRQMEDCVCTNYTVVTADTTAFENGRWYAVTGTVSRGMIAVNGSAYLILCDGAKLSVQGDGNEAGLAVEAGHSLAIYGQALGTGELVAKAKDGKSGNRGAGIGGASGRPCGAVTIDGGRVTAVGGWDGAGIGGGYNAAGGTITINGGQVAAKGNGAGSGLGNGWKGAPGVTRINGGTVLAESGETWSDQPFGKSSTVIVGGSVRAANYNNTPAVKGDKDANAYCVTVKCEGMRDQGSGIRLRLEGLGNYGTNDIYAVEGKVYLWLPNGTYHFTLSDGTTTYRYCAVVKGRGITVEPLAPVGFFVNGKDIGDTGSGTGWDYNKDMKNLTLSAVGPYVLSGAATNNEVQVKVATGGATVVLSNAVVFTSGRPALDVAQSAALQMAGGTSYLAATNNVMALSVGPNAVLTVGLAPGANEAEAMIGVFNYGDPAAIAVAGEVKVVGGTLAVWADRRASEVPLTRAADVFCMLAGSDPETAKVVDTYDGEAYVFVTASVAPVTPGTPIGPFATAEAATNAAKKAVLNPRDDVAAKLGEGSSALETYCNMFGFAVTGGGTAWSVEAALTPEAWTNVTESAQDATRQIPLADIAALPLNTPTNVTAKGCGVPGFYYSFYSGSTMTNIGAIAVEEGRNVLCGTDRDVEFGGVVKPSDKSGFFSIGVKETPGITPSDGSLAPITIKPGATVEVK